MSVRILERDPRYAAFGVRFWDGALDRAAEEPIVVTARPADDPFATPVRAGRTLSGAHAFLGLPGLASAERGGGALDPGSPPASPPPTRPFVVEVRDPGGTHLPVAFSVDLPLPYRGLFLGPGAGSPAAQPGFLLFPAPTRRRPGWLAAVRGELARADGSGPAAHALVEVEDPDGAVWHGIADAAGRYAVLLPWPAPAVAPPGSPGLGGGVPVSAQGWDLTVSVRLAPAPLPVLAGTDLPDLADILTQPPAEIWAMAPGDGGAAEADWIGPLDQGEELTPRTDGLSHLLVGPAPGSP